MHSLTTNPLALTPVPTPTVSLFSLRASIHAKTAMLSRCCYDLFPSSLLHLGLSSSILEMLPSFEARNLRRASRSHAQTGLGSKCGKNQRKMKVFAMLRHLVGILLSSSILGPSWGHLGPSWGPLGRVLGPSWGHLGPSWGHLGALPGCEKHCKNAMEN